MATVTVLGAAGWQATHARAAAPAAASLAVAGITAPVEILTDRWGVPHIFARSTDDAFFAQGFQAARDRLWQMDLWRKRGTGEMAKDFGPEYVEADRLARAFLFRGDMDREWLAYGSDAKRIAEAFVRGVNAYVALTQEKPELLPMEFRWLGYQPSRWSAADVVRIRHHGLTLNFTSEVDRAAAYCLGKSDGRRIDWLRRELSPAVEPVVPDGLDVCAIPAPELRKAYAQATSVLRFTRDLSRPATSDTGAAGGYGSNNWTIAPSKTTTHRPILASDPHRAHGAPSLRYITHVSAPGLDVIGAGEPFLPGISIGHNGTIGFGLTRFYIDQEDLYVYELSPGRPNEYRYQRGFEAMRVVSETIEVKGEAPRAVTLEFTRHGPLLHRDAARSRAYALRAAWLEPGMAPYFGSIEYMRARNWEQFQKAMRHWGAPGENQVYADTAGNIGWIPAGLTPIRPNWDGLLPVPGDGRYEWAGFRSRDELPSETNPARGYVVTANENNIPPGHPASGKGVGYEWSDSARAQRLATLLAAKPRFTLEDSERMQTDTVSTQAQRMVTLLQGLRSDDARVSRALEILRGWDGDEASGSAAAAIFEAWFGKHLRPALLSAALGEAGARLAAPGDPSRLLALLQDPGRYGIAERRDAVMLSTLSAALDEIEAKLGKDTSVWRWGALHQAAFEHPLRIAAPDAVRDKLTVASGPIGGSGSTPMATSYRAGDFALTGGASFRMVLDVGRWDDSRAINAPGQSGDPESPHFRDLAPLWAAGKYFPLLYSRAAVERATESRLLLRPK